jgi:hypothetical protein
MCEKISDPAADALARRKTISELWSTWIGLVALILGGLFAMFQYLEKEKADRARYSMDFLKQYNAKEVFDARQHLARVWGQRQQMLSDLARAETDAARKHGAYVLETIEQEKLSNDIVVMADFYEKIQICSERSLCDPVTSKALFRKDAMHFYRLHYSYIQEVRSKADKTFAAELEDFVNGK